MASKSKNIPKPPTMSRDDMRLALERAWADTLAVAEAVRESNAEAGPSVRLAVREITGGLLALDRVVASLT